MVKGQRDLSIMVAHMSYGIPLDEIADYLRIHYDSVNKMITKAAASKK
jgi:DNA-binding CsgD family transcriptional regulator